ncbi:PAS domain S-box-containing protein [Hydrogenoanaerobacterium saccharovorans]|uniref:PAS domain S-box-containing protein n=1 Tax=Hydrogenoanaerobacterium saccharovorans TaxID=474960 RepID=A0A1H8BGK7_9FIRM|nr:[Fe-Fe] hydrogenase large subunit C-terminal domain-containing protein [Hydrogenoanaerobacterium saccharovorans]RPF47450.1 PAS domain S-box-containing protein [Hydrogenoanaerobacterium saccharovorans]SEM81274.1 PAS domain S-box-containing protein [Hydrogenoanaerobacterium saccharovorans]
MSVIELNPTNCQNCYKCIRECPIKAIAFKDGRAKIIDKECILCGICVQCCPQNAKYIRNDVDAVKALIESGKPVYASIAPSWQGWYDTDEFGAISDALKKLGFAGVEETAIGAAETSREYAELMKTGSMKNIIGTACSSVVMLIERKYPELIKALSPVSSPMMAHARLMRETYGDIKVVFVGPCLSKKDEAADPLAGGLVNQALTFSSLDRWLREENITLGTIDQDALGVKNRKSRLYPKPRGILATIPSEQFGKYRPMAVDGIFRCIELFDAMKNGELENVFVEANICAGSCLGGPIMRMGGKRSMLLEERITDRPLSHDDICAPTAATQFPHPRVFANRADKAPIPSEEDIKKILARIGKYTPEQELNCGSCGYPNCRAKAIAVYQGKADINMCLPFFRERAENMSNMVMEHSPNAIIAFDHELLVQELNPNAEEMFRVSRAEIMNMPIPEFYGETAFDEAKKTGKAVSKKARLFSNNHSVEETYIYIREHNMYLAFVKDISDEEKRQNELAQLRAHTIDTAQQVIDKQMRVAQEIASLLGETTAETKVALTNLKRSMSGEAGNTPR